MEQNHYRQAEDALMRVAAAVQRQEPVNLTELTHLAGSIVESIQENDQLVVEALSSPVGPPLVTNLVNVSILATKVGIGLGCYVEGTGVSAITARSCGVWRWPGSCTTSAFLPCRSIY